MTWLDLFGRERHCSSATRSTSRHCSVPFRLFSLTPVFSFAIFIATSLPVNWFLLSTLSFHVLPNFSRLDGLSNILRNGVLLECRSSAIISIGNVIKQSIHPFSCVKTWSTLNIVLIVKRRWFVVVNCSIFLISVCKGACGRNKTWRGGWRHDRAG